MALGSFSAALSGLSASSEELTVIGNNLANLNTVGFKGSTMTFSDLVSQTVGSTGANPAQLGLGVGTGSISPNFSQGSIQNTTSATDAAIQGAGFFIVSNAGGNSYTRNGNFTINANGALVTQDGKFVQGYTQTDPVTGAIITTGQPTNISVPLGVLRPPVPTTNFAATTNLDGNAKIGDTFSTSVQIYDSLGQPHVLTMDYANTGPGAWTWTLNGAGAEVTGGTPGTPDPLGTGTLTFDAAGKLKTFDGGAPANPTIVTPTWVDGAGVSKLTWGVLDPNLNPTLSGFAAGSATSSVSQNGFAPGLINSISISSDGSIIAAFGAGQSVSVAKLALATFNNPQGMSKLGTNTYGATDAAGQPSVGAAGTGSRGTLIGSALEQSNVDISAEFTAMILAQRSYQANAKTISTSDQVLVETVNLKQ
jgi:flagellar hook protein FlgE